VVVASLALIMAAQRTIVWTVFPSILVLHILARGVGKTVVIGGLLVTLFIGYDVADWLLAGNDIVGRLGRFTDRASDEGRIASLKFAIDQIAARPFWGNTRGMGFDIGIHNGFLNGWAKFGILWAAAFAVATYTTIKSVVARSYIPLWCRVGGLLLLGVMLANVMGHTNSPGQDDMTFMIAVGLILALLQQAAVDTPVIKRVSWSVVRPSSVRARQW